MKTFRRCLPVLPSLSHSAQNHLTIGHDEGHTDEVGSLIPYLLTSFLEQLIPPTQVSIRPGRNVRRGSTQVLR
ncbi:hypothetical protein E2C01_084015 [Portunus trituberculatus]|uniref:Uncharacterized protein n=1 Tax=Portunus trituberculatus TaxID=210409 RepID=A0A5B7J568_PORTR|nr:hypothetical protein [Portunus trituberculatus]